MAKSFLLTRLLNEMNYGLEFKVINEKSFEMLALATQDIEYDTCVFIASLKFAEHLPNNVAMVLTTPELEKDLTDRPFGICIVEDPRNTFFDLHNYLSKTGKLKRETFKTEIDESAQIHPLSSIASNNVRIGKNVLVEEFVVIRENTVIGDNSIIRAGTVIGGVGFEFKKRGHELVAVAHEGGVLIGNNVELQQHCAVDRAVFTWDDTVIGNDTKADNFVHFAHGIKVGKRVLNTAGVVYAGRVTVGNDSWIGINSTIRNGILIGSNARVNMGAVVTRDVPEGGSVTGNFAIDHEEFIARLKRESNK